LNSGTTHGLVCGRETGGSAVMGLDDPICGLEGTVTTCATPALAHTNESAAARRVSRTLGEDIGFIEGDPFGLQKMPPRIARAPWTFTGK
jgi:hypothetical protein